MKKLENFKKETFAKELTKRELKSVKGSKVLESGTKTSCTGTTGNTQGQDCSDTDGID